MGGCRSGLQLWAPAVQLPACSFTNLTQLRRLKRGSPKLASLWLYDPSILLASMWLVSWLEDVGSTGSQLNPQYTGEMASDMP